MILIQFLSSQIIYFPFGHGKDEDCNYLLLSLFLFSALVSLEKNPISIKG